MMEVVRSGELWRVGLLIEAESSFSVFQESPLSVILHYRSDSPTACPSTIAMCKGSLLGTYVYTNEYDGMKNSPVQSTSLDKCRWPNVLVVPAVASTGEISSIKQDVDVQCPEDLQTKLSSPLPVSPTIVLATQDFLTTYGFFSKERIWFRPAQSVPLERIILTPG